MEPFDPLRAGSAQRLDRLNKLNLSLLKERV